MNTPSIQQLNDLRIATWPEVTWAEFVELLSYTSYPISVEVDKIGEWKEQLLEMKVRSQGNPVRAIILEEDNHFREVYKLIGATQVWETPKQ